MGASRVTRVERNSAGIEQVLSSPAVAAEIKRRTDAIARAAGPGMRSEVKQQGDRQVGTVWTGTHQAKQAEAKDRALTRAIDAGRS